MTILITGVAGFIASHTAEKLLKLNYQVIGIDNLNDYYDPKLKQQNLNILNKYQNFIFEKDDIVTSKCIDKYKPHKVIHLAAMAGVRYSLENPTLYCRVNIEGTVNLLEQSKNNNVELFVYASSSSVYGNMSGEFKEERQLNPPESIYAATKRSKEMMADLYYRLYGLRVIGLRFFTVYGPRGRPDMAPRKFMERILNDIPIDKYGNGYSYRDYTYIDDIVDGIIKSLFSDLNNEILNLGNNQTHSLNSFINTMEKVCQKKAIINQKGKQPGDVNGTNANIDKSKKLINYNPQTSLKEGLTKIYFQNK